jgi:hypothetical protein
MIAAHNSPLNPTPFRRRFAARYASVREGKAVRIMKPISSIHAGEYLVGTHIEENYKTFNVWLPSKDTGIDLLVTDKTNSKTVSLQVKFSKDFLGSLGNSLSEVVTTKVKSGGWWTFNPEKIRSSRADLWVLVLYRFSRRDYDLLVIEPTELLRRYEKLTERALFRAMFGSLRAESAGRREA